MWLFLHLNFGDRFKITLCQRLKLYSFTHQKAWFSQCPHCHRNSLIIMQHQLLLLVCVPSDFTSVFFQFPPFAFLSWPAWLRAEAPWGTTRHKQSWCRPTGSARRRSYATSWTPCASLDPRTWADRCGCYAGANAHRCWSCAALPMRVAGAPRTRWNTRGEGRPPSTSARCWSGSREPWEMVPPPRSIVGDGDGSGRGRRSWFQCRVRVSQRCWSLRTCSRKGHFGSVAWRRYNRHGMWATTWPGRKKHKLEIKNMTFNHLCYLIQVLLLLDRCITKCKNLKCYINRQPVRWFDIYPNE